jgi:hypothetical protein
MFPLTLTVKILLTKNQFQFPENRKVPLRLDHALGEGSYGYVFQTHDQYAIKIFKNSICGETALSNMQDMDTGNHLFPEDHENRELLFYIRLLQRNPELYTCSIRHILQPYAVGVTTSELSLPEHQIQISSQTYFVILPLCIPFYEAVPIRGIPLLNQPLLGCEDYMGVEFVLHVMHKLCIASKYMEEEFQLYHLDLKMGNIMFLKPMDMDMECSSGNEGKRIPLEELIVLDFGLIKHAPSEAEKNQTFSYNTDIHYFIWPFSKTTILQNIPSYSICMDGLELLFGKKTIDKSPSYKISRKIMKDLLDYDKELHDLFQLGFQRTCSVSLLKDRVEHLLASY